MSDQAEDTVSGGVSQEPVAEVAPVAEAAPVDAAADDAAADGASRTAVGMGAAR